MKQQNNEVANGIELLCSLFGEEHPIICPSWTLRSHIFSSELCSSGHVVHVVLRRIFVPLNYRIPINKHRI
jgi:hypothetical protein